MDQALEVFDRGRGELDPSHGSELVEGNRMVLSSLFESELRSVERSGDPIQDLDDVVRVDVCLVDGVRKERSGERALLDMGPLCEPGELGGVLLVESDIQPSATGSHSCQGSTELHELCTRLVTSNSSNSTACAAG